MPRGAGTIPLVGAIFEGAADVGLAKGRVQRFGCQDGIGGVLLGYGLFAILRILIHLAYRNLRCIGLANRELIATQTQLDGVAERSFLLHRDTHARREAHVEDMLAKLIGIAIDTRDDGGRAHGQLVERTRCVMSSKVRCRMCRLFVWQCLSLRIIILYQSQRIASANFLLMIAITDSIR